MVARYSLRISLAEASKAGFDTEESNAKEIKADQRGADEVNEPQADAPPPKRQATDAAKQEAGNEAGTGQDAGPEEANAQAPLEKKAEMPDTVIEEGRIFFLFRPKVDYSPVIHWLFLLLYIR